MDCVQLTIFSFASQNIFFFPLKSLVNSYSIFFFFILNELLHFTRELVAERD